VERRCLVDLAVRLGERTAGDGEASGSESRQWQGRLIVTDAFGQTVFDSAGLVQCG